MIDKNILKNLTLLYVEDEINIRQNMIKSLHIFTPNVLDCGSAEDALELFSSHHVDIIISDINLPKMNGINFVKKIRETDELIPILLLTSHISTEYLLEATRLKLMDYLIKPINFTQLNDALQKTAKELLKHARLEINFLNNRRYNLQTKILSDCEKEAIKLTYKEILLLEHLINNQNRVISQEELKEMIWQDTFDATDSALKNLLNKLRGKIGKESISNTSGIGYRLELNR